VNELADRVARVATEFDLKPVIEHPADPRVEAEQHYYNPIHEHLPALGYKRTRELDEVVREIFTDLLRFRRRLEARRHVVVPTVQWRVPDSRPLLAARAGPERPDSAPPSGSPSIGSPA
jgi:UDP-sulfoquinovose synthase